MMKPAAREHGFEGIALVALFLAAAPGCSAQALFSCLDGYQGSYGALWELTRDDWAKLCVQNGSPGGALRAGADAFVVRCAAGAQSAVNSGLLKSDEARALCAQGVPGRDRIPRPLGHSLEPPPGSMRLSAPPDVKAGLDALKRRIDAAVSADVATLYGERTAGIEPNPAPAADGKPVVVVAPQPISARPPLRVGADERREFGPDIPPPVLESPIEKVKAPYVEQLEARLTRNGVSRETFERLRVAYHAMLETLDVSVLKTLVDKNVALTIIPKDAVMTDLPAFSALKGRKTLDGRPWETLRGVGGVGGGKGTGNQLAVAVPEENIVSPGISSGFPNLFIFFHEFGHAVEDEGLPERTPPPKNAVEKARRALTGDPPSRERIREIYRAALARPQKTGLGAYADSDEREFWAQATAAFFGCGYVYLKNPEDKTPFQETPESLEKADPDLYKLMFSVYAMPGKSS